MAVTSIVMTATDLKISHKLCPIVFREGTKGSRIESCISTQDIGQHLLQKFLYEKKG